MNELWRIGYSANPASDSGGEHYCNILDGTPGGTEIIAQDYQGAPDPMMERDEFLGKVIAEANRRSLRIVGTMSDDDGLLLFFTRIQIAAHDA